MPTLWQASIDVPAIARPAAEVVLGAKALSVSAFAAAPDDSVWRMTAIFAGRPGEKALTAALAAILPEKMIAALTVTKLPTVDWVAASLATLEPITVQRFRLHGSHHPRKPPPTFDLLIEAGQAFGTGNHETTRGCLRALAALGRRYRKKRVLDFGTGTGVLGLAATRLWHKPVLGLDIDPVAIHVARENARRNDLHPWFRAYPADGLGSRRVARKAPFDLIFANLFARPLVRLAPAIATHLEPGGHAVLSGLLQSQAAAVISAYRRAGLALRHRNVEGGWVTLTLQRPPRPDAAKRRFRRH